MNYRENLKDKKRIVVKIGSSSITHPETGALNLTKLEVLVRELCDLKNRGKRSSLSLPVRLQSDDRRSVSITDRKMFRRSRHVRRSDRHS